MVATIPIFIDNVSITAPLPFPPASLGATAGTGQVTLNWAASSGATGYNVERSTTSGGPYTTVAAGVTGTNYTDTGVANGIPYYYVVTGDRRRAAKRKLQPGGSDAAGGARWFNGGSRQSTGDVELEHRGRSDQLQRRALADKRQ